MVDKFALKLNVENGGENAFLSKMTVQYEDDFEPIGVKFINVSYLCLYAMLFLRAQNENFNGKLAEVGILSCRDVPWSLTPPPPMPTKRQKSWS